MFLLVALSVNEPEDDLTCELSAPRVIIQQTHTPEVSRRASNSYSNLLPKSTGQYKTFQTIYHHVTFKKWMERWRQLCLRLEKSRIWKVWLPDIQGSSWL